MLGGYALTKNMGSEGIEALPHKTLEDLNAYKFRVFDYNQVLPIEAKLKDIKSETVVVAFYNDPHQYDRVEFSFEPCEIPFDCQVVGLAIFDPKGQEISKVTFARRKMLLEGDNLIPNYTIIHNRRPYHGVISRELEQQKQFTTNKITGIAISTQGELLRLAYARSQDGR